MSNKSINNWYTGTSGFMISKKQWTSIPDLNCIEINSTFYKLPSEKTINNWKNLPTNIVFSIKCSKYITHIKRLKDCKLAWYEFYNRIKVLGERLKAILIQLPPSFNYNDDTLNRIKIMSQYLPKNKNISIVFEFRNNSWFIPKIIELFKKYNFCLGGTDISRPTNKYWLGNLPTGLHLPKRTSNTSYLRLHGSKGYRGFYSKKKLKTIKNLINKKRTKKNFVIFNNTFFPKYGKTCKINKKKIKYAAICNASTFSQININ